MAPRYALITSGVDNSYNHPHQVTLDAQALWRDGAGPLRKHYDLSHAAAELGMVCGGKIDVEFEVRR